MRKGGRRSIRLSGYNYASSGTYFVTLCLNNPNTRLSDIDQQGRVHLTDLGQLAQQIWQAIPAHFPDASTDSVVFMPDHVHGIIIIQSTAAESDDTLPPPQRGPAPKSLGAIIGQFKSSVARQAGQSSIEIIAPLWQRNYYERIIRDEAGLIRVRRYIAENPARWSRL